MSHRCRDLARWRRALVAALLLLGLLAGGTAPALAGPTRAVQEGEPSSTTVTTPTPEAPGDGIIPEPGSGRPPEEAGDRGGALQLAVLLLIVVGVGVIATQVVRQARRNRAGSSSDM